ncbi:MAG: hypothetical protein OXE94_07190 [Aestuariivita sp.]|nr:hypothetical protein [Aestuariivita sp.]MCY4202775.1 hypothetical protein [Aestuariivita sp.]
MDRNDRSRFEHTLDEIMVNHIKREKLVAELREANAKADLVEVRVMKESVAWSLLASFYSARS